MAVAPGGDAAARSEEILILRMSSQPPDILESLSDAYDVVAELHARDDAQTYMGTRREDGARVLIHVARTPKGDEGNALTHYAADANLLAGLRHRNLIPVLEARWLDADTLAVVTQRVAAPDLEEVLARGEELSYPRIAAILREVNGLLDWARSQGVVHRCVDATTVHIEPGSEHVLASFVVTPIPFTGSPGAEGDARTVARLARTMLTRDTEESERSQLPIGELRPDLPEEIVEQTERLLHPSPAAEAPPDVRGYIATIAMADALALGEDETARVAAQLLQAQRDAREQLAAERTEFERLMAEQREQLVREREEQERKLAAQGETLERSYTDRREELERGLEEREKALERSAEEYRESLDRAASRRLREIESRLDVEREALEREREMMRREHESFEHDLEEERQALVELREEMERKLRKERERLTAEREELLRREARVAAYEQRIEERLHELELRENAVVLAADAVPDARAEREPTAPVSSAPEHALPPAKPVQADTPLTERARRFLLGGTLAAVALTVVSAAALARRAASPAADAEAASLTVSRPAPRVDSAAGRIAIDTTARPGAASARPEAQDTTATASRPRATRRPAAVPRDSERAAAADDPIFGPPAPESRVDARIDSILRATPLRPRLTPGSGNPRPDTARDTTSSRRVPQAPNA